MKKLLATLSFIVINLVVFSQTKGQRIDSLFQSLNQDGELSGAFLVVDSGKIIYEHYFGYQDEYKKNKIDELSRFELASVSKQFTAMAIMQLEEKGKLSYEDEINKYFPNLKFKGVKIKNLLRNTSGIPEFLGWDASWIDKNKINNNADILNIVENKIDTLVFTPGEKYWYSNTNWILLSLIVEKVTGESFAKYMQKNIFKPAGMTNTSVFSARTANVDLKNYAQGLAYDAKSKSFKSVDDSHSYTYVKYFDGIHGPYGISSTAQDLWKWNQALYNHTLLKKEKFLKAISVDTLNNGKSIQFSGLYYGHGWRFTDSTDNEDKIHFHTGGYPGYHTIVVRENLHQRYFIGLINKWNTLNVYPLTAAIDKILRNQEVPKIERETLSEAIVLMEFQVKQLIGTYAYQEQPELKFEITADDDGNIFAQLTGQQSVQVYPKSELELFYTAVKADLKFSKENDQVKDLTLFQNGQVLKFNKIK